LAGAEELAAGSLAGGASWGSGSTAALDSGAFFAAGFAGSSFAGAFLGAGKASRTLRMTGASSVEDGPLTYSPISINFAIRSLLGTPSSFAIS
jgi:hypothetical protein